MSYANQAARRTNEESLQQFKNRPVRHPFFLDTPTAQEDKTLAQKAADTDTDELITLLENLLVMLKNDAAAVSRTATDPAPARRGTLAEKPTPRVDQQPSTL